MLDLLFIKPGMLIYHHRPVVKLLGKDHDTAVERLTPYLKDGRLSQRDFDHTMKLVDTVMNDRFSLTNRIMHYAGFFALITLASRSSFREMRWSFTKRVAVNVAAAMVGTEGMLLNRVILLDHTRWENSLENRAGMRGIICDLEQLNDGRSATVQDVHSTRPVETTPASRWSELRARWATSAPFTPSPLLQLGLEARREGGRPTEESEQGLLATPTHETLDMTADERRFDELIRSRERTSSC